MNLFWKKRAGTVTVAGHDLERLEGRVGLLAKDDVLWPLLRGLVRRNLEIETEAVAKSGIDDAEAHRARGRVGMLLDLDGQLEEVWGKGHGG